MDYDIHLHGLALSQFPSIQQSRPLEESDSLKEIFLVVYFLEQ
jgi:hypothetical protein